MLEEHNVSVERNVELLKEMFGILHDKNVAELLAHVHDVVRIYFDVYTGKAGMIEYTTFVGFCKDFSIFPELCSKMVLHSTFYALAFVNSRVIDDPDPSTRRTHHPT